VEDIVNRQIWNNISVHECHMTKDEAHQVGATMLFGEKYGTNVRAILVSKYDCKQPKEAWSMELCGGTHVDETGQIGLFKIVSQSAVSAGVRRMEAVCGSAALAAVRRMENKLQLAAETLKTTPDDLFQRLEKIMAQEKQLEKEIAAMKSTALRSQFDDVAKQAVSVGGINVVARVLEGADDKQMREVADRLRDVLASVNEEKVGFVVSVQKALTERGIHAGQLAKSLSGLLEGSGGGRPDFAQGGGKNLQALTSALAQVEALVKNQLKK
jgi:alanyl-tRNA synthetase